MLKLNKVILHNFGSYADAEIDLAEKGFCLVSGQNLYTADNALSNGSGKSLIFEAIIYALTGVTSRGVSSGLKNDQAEKNDNMSVKLLFELNGHNYEVVRGEQ